MKKMIVITISLFLSGFLSAQTTTTKTTTTKELNKPEQPISTATSKTVTKSTPILKKKLVVVSSSKVNQASGVVKEGDKSKNIDKKDVENSEPK